MEAPVCCCVIADGQRSFSFQFQVQVRPGERKDTDNRADTRGSKVRSMVFGLHAELSSPTNIHVAVPR